MHLLLYITLSNDGKLEKHFTLHYISMLASPLSEHVGMLMLAFASECCLFLSIYSESCRLFLLLRPLHHFSGFIPLSLHIFLKKPQNRSTPLHQSELCSNS
ncbi:hypothetical protein XENOCAPTIV_018532 [Xenoophorus captivus]|uniref:Uncharacterized protein n=1 Tax=Xenoophorus captivus TaxID=1517983 RepID=A0ABV0QVV0_9TELE